MNSDTLSKKCNILFCINYAHETNLKCRTWQQRMKDNPFITVIFQLSDTYGCKPKERQSMLDSDIMVLPILFYLHVQCIAVNTKF